MPRAVADLVSDPRHAGAISGAHQVGEAAGGNRLVVRLGVWTDPEGRVVRARYRATTCASLIAYAEAACLLLEAGCAPAALAAVDLHGAVTGVHPGHRDRADLVAAAVRAAVSSHPQSTPPEGSPA